MEQTFFRQICGNFATGVTIITSAKEDDTRTGFTANSFTSVSLDPALVLFCLSKKAHSSDFFDVESNVGISILSEEQRELSNRFSNPNLNAAERFEGVNLISEATAPILKDCVAWLEGSVTSRVDGGDHWIYICKINQGGIEKSSSSPLLYAMGSYKSLKQ